MSNNYVRQKAVELVTAKNHHKSRVMTFLLEEKGIAKIVEGLEKEEVEFVYEMLYQLILRKRIDIVTASSLFMHIIEDPIECIGACVRVLKLKLCKYDPVREQFVVSIDVPEDIQAELNRFQYPLPMIIKPRRLKSNKSTGYITLRGSLLLKDNHHEEDINLNHLNRMNSIKLTMNINTFNNTTLIWNNMKKPDSIYKLREYEKKIEAYNKYRVDSTTTANMLLSLGNEFYLTHKYDKRGRTYCQGYHIDTQGSDWNKAFVELADKEIVEL